MSVTLWSIGVLLVLLAVVIATVPMRRRERSRPKLTVGSISGDWLSEYNARLRLGKS